MSQPNSVDYTSEPVGPPTPGFPTRPDMNRQTPDSIDSATDLCRKWSLWGRGDHIDSVICCKLFSRLHRLTDADIAIALARLHPECANMTAQDVADLYAFLEAHPDLHTNSIRMWQSIKANWSGREHQLKVDLAIRRFLNAYLDAFLTRVRR